MKKILLGAMFLYILMAPFTYHPDTKLTLYYASLNNGKVWNVYDYLEKNKLSVPEFHYPPLHFLLLKPQYLVAKVIGGEGFNKWLAIDSTSAVSNINIFKYNLASKLVLIILTVLTGLFIYKIVIKNNFSESKAKLATKFWLFNPITIYSIILMGQNDILAIFPFILGILFYFNLPIVAFLLFGVASSIKTFPLIWSIFLGLLYPTKNIFKKIFLALIPLIVYSLTLVPYINSEYFRKSVIFSGLTERMFQSYIDIGFMEKILVIPMILVLLLTMVYGKKFILKNISLVLMSVNLVILGFSHFHPQWMVWVIPFWAVYFSISNNKERSIQLILFLLLFLSLVVILLLFDDKFLSWGIFSPINPYLLNLPTIREVLILKNIDYGLLNNLAHSAIAGLSIWSVVKNLQLNKK